MTDLNTLANLAEIFSAFVVLGGLGVGAIQMQHYRQQRREKVAIALLRSFHNRPTSNIAIAGLEGWACR